MRKELVRLAEAVRSLRLTRTDRAAPHCVRIGVAASEFPLRLSDLQAALEAFDAAGGSSSGAVASEDDMERMRGAVDSVFRWMRLQGIDTAEPLRILAEGLTGKPQKRQASYDMLPSYAPGKGSGKAKGWKPKLTLGAEFGGRHLSGMSLADHLKLAGDMQQAVLKLGSTAPTTARKSAKELMALVDADAAEPAEAVAMTA